MGRPDAAENPPGEVPAGWDGAVALLGATSGDGAAAAAALGTDPGPSPTAAGSPFSLRDVKPAARGVGSPSTLLRAGLTKHGKGRRQCAPLATVLGGVEVAVAMLASHAPRWWLKASKLLPVARLLTLSGPLHWLGPRL